MSFTRYSKTGFAGVVILHFPSLEVVERHALQGELTFPYIPGLLSFREAPLLLRLFESIKTRPDLIFLDGQGIAHPRGLGLACHIGLFLDTPTIGCAKTRLTGSHDPVGENKNDSVELWDQDQKKMGYVLRSRNRCKPIFISPGHQISAENSLKWTLDCISSYRIPEPTRQAHLWVNEERKRLS